MPGFDHTSEEQTILTALGKEIRRRRLERDLSVQQLASRASVTRAYVHSIEKGRRNPSLLTMRRLADALDATLDELSRSERSA